jgi:two-component sensor histidine kinase
MGNPTPSSVAESLTLAVIASSSAPLLLLDGALTIIAASGSFCSAFGVAPDSVTGKALAELGSGEWAVPQLENLLVTTASGSAEVDAYEMDFDRAGKAVRRLVIKARKLSYDDADNVRLLVSIVDVTEAKLAEKLREEMLRDKHILLQELQHRVANSLQIVASVLLQSAKRVQSDDARGHLYDAHNRVMSVAAVQKQLATSRQGDVALKPYFTELCRSVGASMIHDHDQISLELSADESVTSADVSVSLGLIVTELVINALKHAFPGHRKGIISVDYHSKGPDWTLSVGDDGVGMPVDPGSAPAGLGTSIIEALSKQLRAHVVVTDAHPGSKVSIVHDDEKIKGAAAV